MAKVVRRWLVVAAFVSMAVRALESWRPVVVNVDELAAKKDAVLLNLRKGLRAGAVAVSFRNGFTDSQILSAVTACTSSTSGAGQVGGLTALGSIFSAQVAAACPNLLDSARRYRDLASVVALASAAVADISAKDYGVVDTENIATESVRGGLALERYAVSSDEPREATRALPDVGVFVIILASTYPRLVMRGGRIVAPEVPQGAALLLVGDAMRLISPEFTPMPFITRGLGAFASISFSIHDDFVGRESQHLQAEERTTLEVSLSDGFRITDLAVANDVDSTSSPFCKPGAMTMHMAGFVTVIGGKDDNCINYFFTDFTLSTPLRFLLALIVSILLGVAAEALQSYRRSFKGSILAKMLLYLLNITLGYAVMLIVMTYSVELTLGAMLGLACGHGGFNANAKLTGSVSPCCVVRAPSENVLANRTYKVDGMKCQACAMTIKGALLRLDFVEQADVDFREGRATIFMSKTIQHAADRLDGKVVDAVEEVGFDVEAFGYQPLATPASEPLL